jgi:hypothetical protein
MMNMRAIFLEGLRRRNYPEQHSEADQHDAERANRVHQLLHENRPIRKEASWTRKPDERFPGRSNQ